MGDLIDKFKEGDYDDPYSTVEESWIDIDDGKIIITPSNLDTDSQRFANAMDDMLEALKDIEEPVKPVIIHDKEKEIILGYLKDYKEAFKSGKYYHPNDRIMRANLWVGNTRIDPWDLGARKEDFDRAMDDMIATLAERGLKGEPAVVID